MIGRKGQWAGHISVHRNYLLLGRKYFLNVGGSLRGGCIRAFSVGLDVVSGESKRSVSRLVVREIVQKTIERKYNFGNVFYKRTFLFC